MGLDVGEVKSQFLLDRWYKEEILLGLGDVADVHAQQAQLLILGFLLEALVVVEEPSGGLDDFVLVDAPHVLEVVDDRGLFVEGLQHLLVRHVVKTQDTVADSGGLEDLDPPDFRGIVAVSAAACLHIYSLDVDHSDFVAWHDTALVQVEAVLGLGLLLALEVFVDWVSLKDDPVCLVLDLHLDLLGDGGVVSDIEMCVIFGLLGAVLPDVRAEHSPGRCVDDVGAGVEGSEGVSAFDVDLSLDGLADD